MLLFEYEGGSLNCRELRTEREGGGHIARGIGARAIDDRDLGGEREWMAQERAQTPNRARELLLLVVDRNHDVERGPVKGRDRRRPRGDYAEVDACDVCRAGAD